ncbi:hypothetical protein [Streptomyces albipurpureus]|uniref:Secreted protein n=1 Tax=Streptomyces albipurpureus TaxID=2897419 RepID=A0ABT0UH76_9ACTN|nr:hypothetical protein [Streptomyces sp. CWNU-1]MCM2387455.1 hypothetical protein [Streptomyces sp. CWNU-1]
MNILSESLPELLGAVGSAGVVGLIAWCVRNGHRRRLSTPDAHGATDPAVSYRSIRRYTLLGTSDVDSGPIQVASTRQAGTIMVWQIGARNERFELTNVYLDDGTFAAEPVERYEDNR